MASAKNAAPIVVEDVTSRIAARVEELRVARQTYLDQAQRQMSAFDAAIGELEAVLKPPEPAPAIPATNGVDLPEQMALPVAAG